jgi:hypothetical protein
MSSTSTQALLDRIESSWKALRIRLDNLSLDELDGRLADGRTVKQALAEVAFWNETCAPVFAWMRGQPEVPVSEWYGGADLGLPPGAPWPKDDVHRAREAAWADSMGHDAVLDRLETAHSKAIATIATLSPDEWRPSTERSSAGVPTEHPWAEMSNHERLIAKANSCTYAVYDELVEQLT